MKYLFFDIECSNCFGGNNKICEFGYVLTDENFNVIKKEDIPMSPGNPRNRENRFDLSIKKRDPKFEWAYEIEYYFSCPEFPHYYEEIKKLIEDEDTVVFGFSVDNDIRYLGSAYKRYKLEPYKYVAYDVQIMMRLYSERKERIRGLENTFKQLCSIEEFISLQPHLSRDDAYMTMRVLQEMCRNLDVTLNELIELCPECRYDATAYLEKYNAKAEDRRLHPELYRGGHKLTEGEIIWYDFSDKQKSLLEDENSIGKIYAINSTIKKDKDLVQKIINNLVDRNYIACSTFNKSNYLIVLDQEDKDQFQAILNKPYEGVIITLEEFLNGAHVGIE